MFISSAQLLGRRSLLRLWFVTIVLFFAACSGQGAGAQKISPQDYQTKFGANGAKHLLLDVRTPEEYASGHIAGAQNIAVDTLEQHLGEVPKDQPVVVYCHSGNRSARAAQILQKAGYTQIFDLGGVVQWQQAGFPLQ
ncbi:MAG: rhodanese-like domain-containing protein [Caldilineaceae bacterium]